MTLIDREIWREGYWQIERYEESDWERERERDEGSDIERYEESDIDR